MKGKSCTVTLREREREKKEKRRESPEKQTSDIIQPRVLVCACLRYNGTRRL